MDLGAVQALENAANATPKTDRTVAIKRPTPVSQNSPTTPMTPVAQTLPPDGRVSKGTLRIIFGAIAIAIAAYLYSSSAADARRVAHHQRVSRWAAQLFDKSVISIGRHPLNDLRFDPERDPDASSKHAEIRILGDKATLHDLDSTNGTFVNGQRIAGERALFDGDLMSFGREGPAVGIPFRSGGRGRKTARGCIQRSRGGRFVCRGGSGPSVGSAPRYNRAHRRCRAGADGHAAQNGDRPRRPGDRRSRRRVLDGATRGSAIAGARRRTARRSDSLSAMFEKTVGSMKGRVAGLDSALAASKKETDQIRSRIKGEIQKGGDANVEEALDATRRRGETWQRARS